MRRVLAIWFLCFAVNSFSQKYNFVNWTVEDGLLQSQPSAFSQDQSRQLWIATQGGLGIFDGKKFRAYTIHDGLSSNQVYTILCDRDGKMWIGTSNGISVFDGRRFTTILPADSSINQATFLCQNKDGGIYAICNNNLYAINGLKSQKVNVSGDSAERVTTLFMSPGGNLFAFVYQDGVYLKKDKSWEKWVSTISISKNFNVRNFFISSSGDTLLPSNHGLYCIKNKRPELFRKGNKNMCDLNVIAMAEDSKKNLWLGTDNGVCKLEGNELFHFDEKSGFTDNSVYDIYRDAENNLWFATNGDGIYKFRENTFTYYDRSTGLQNPIVMGVAQTGDGTIYAGGYGGGLYKLNEDRDLERVMQGKIPVLADSRMNCLYADNENNLWIGTTTQGVWSYNKDGAKKLAIPNELNVTSATVFYKDKQGNLLIGSNRGLLLKDKENNITRIKTGKTHITAIKQFDDEHVLIGAANGLAILDKDYKALPYHEKELGEASILCLSKNGDNVWIGTTDKGVINFNDKTGRIINYNTSGGLPSNFIYSMEVSDRRNVWIGTGFGISKLQLDEEGNVKAIKNFGRSDGLLGMECNHNSLLKAKDSSLWFGTTKGLFHFNPNTDIAEKSQPYVLLRSVKLFSSEITDSSLFKSPGAWFKAPEGLKLHSRQNHITFELGSIYFTNPEDVLYKYKLEGIDKVFTTSSNPFIIYPSLPPGIYTLKVTGLTKSGTLSSNTIYYRFEIEKAFYQTRFFQVIVILLLLGTGALLAYMVTRGRQRRKQKAKELLEKIREEEFIKLRQRTAEDFHDEMGNSLTRISVLTDVLKSKINGTEQEVSKLVQQIKENTTALYNGSRDIIWSLNSRNDGMYEIAEHIKDIGNELFQETNIDFQYRHNISAYSTLKLKLDYSRNLTMIFKEAYSNILKHSGATKVEIDLNLNSNQNLEIMIRDNGHGFNPATSVNGNGIRNMRNRCSRMNGEMTLNSIPGKGTEIIMILKNIFA